MEDTVTVTLRLLLAFHCFDNILKESNGYIKAFCKIYPVTIIKLHYESHILTYLWCPQQELTFANLN